MFLFSSKLKISNRIQIVNSKNQLKGMKMIFQFVKSIKIKMKLFIQCIKQINTKKFLISFPFTLIQKIFLSTIEKKLPGRFQPKLGSSRDSGDVAHFLALTYFIIYFQESSKERSSHRPLPLRSRIGKRHKCEITINNVVADGGPALGFRLYDAGGFGRIYSLFYTCG